MSSSCTTRILIDVNEKMSVSMHNSTLKEVLDVVLGRGIRLIFKDVTLWCVKGSEG